MVSNKIISSQGFIEADITSFKESVDENTKKRKYVVEAKVIPYGSVSRNKCLYTEASAIGTMGQINGLPMMIDHVIDGPGVRRVGEWSEAYSVPGDGLYVKGFVYDLPSTQDIIGFLEQASCPKVSLQVQGNAVEKFNDSDGSSYREVSITEWLEISLILGVSGFRNADVKSFETVLAEKFSSLEESVSGVEEDSVDEDEDDKPLALKVPPGDVGVEKAKDEDKNGDDFLFESLLKVRENFMKQ